MKFIQAKSTGSYFRLSPYYVWHWASTVAEATPVPDNLAPALAELIGHYCGCGAGEITIIDAPAPPVKKVTVGWAVKSKRDGDYATYTGWQLERFVFLSREAAKDRADSYGRLGFDKAKVVRVVKKVKS